MYGIMLVRNGAKTYVKNPRVLRREKIRETGSMKLVALQRDGVYLIECL
jgi:hypothetical protein